MAARKPAISSGSAPELHLPGSPFDRRAHSGVASRDSGEGTAGGGATQGSGTDAAAPGQAAAWAFSVDTLDTASPVTRVRDHVAAFSESDSDGEAGDAKLATFPAAMARLQEARSRAPRAPKSSASHAMSRTPSAALGRGAGSGVAAASGRAARGRADSSDVEGLGLHRSGSLQSRAQLKAADSHNFSSSSSGLAPRSLHAASRSHQSGLVAQTAKPSTVDYYVSRVRPRHATSRILLARLLDPRPWSSLGVRVRANLSVLGFDAEGWEAAINKHKYHRFPAAFRKRWAALTQVQVWAAQALGFHPLTWEMERRLRVGIVNIPEWTEPLGNLIAKSAIVDGDEAAKLLSDVTDMLPRPVVAQAALYTGCMLGKHLTPAARGAMLEYALLHCDTPVSTALGGEIDDDEVGNGGGGVGVAPAPDAGAAAATESASTRHRRRAGSMHLYTDRGHGTMVVVRAVVPVESRNDVVRMVDLCISGGYRLSVSGARTTLGSQSCRAGSICIDMRPMAAVQYDPDTQRLHVQPGARWRDVLALAAKHGRTLRCAPLDINSTVGGQLSCGSLSTSAAGLPLSAIVHSVDVVTAEAEIVRCHTTCNRRLLRHVLGGYGLYGVIVEVSLGTVEDAACCMETSEGTGLAAFLDAMVASCARGGDLPCVAGLQVPDDADAADGATWVIKRYVGTTTPPSEGPLAAGAANEAGASTASAALLSTAYVSLSQDPTVNVNLRLSSLCQGSHDAATKDEFLVPMDRVTRFIADLCRGSFLEHGCTVRLVQPRSAAPKATGCLSLGSQLPAKPRAGSAAARADGSGSASGSGFGSDSGSGAGGSRTSASVMGLALLIPSCVEVTQRGLRMRAMDARMTVDSAVRNRGSFSLSNEILFTHDQLASAFPNVEPAFDYKRRVDRRETFTNQLYAAHGAPASVRHGQVVGQSGSRMQASAAAAERSHRSPVRRRSVGRRRSATGSVGSWGSGASGEGSTHSSGLLGLVAAGMSRLDAGLRSDAGSAASGASGGSVGAGADLAVLATLGSRLVAGALQRGGGGGGGGDAGSGNDRNVEGARERVEDTHL